MQKIVIVEDDAAISQMYKIKLEVSGYEIHVAENGKLGLELIKEVKPDLVLLDLMMTEMSGDQMLAQLRKTDWGKDVKVIILTNVSQDVALPKLQKYNIEGFIVKANFTPHQLLDKIHQVLS